MGGVGRRWTAAGMAGAGFVTAALAGLAWPYTVDDAYVAPRYGRHLVEGQGLSFNPGEPAGSFSSLGWVLLAAAVRAVGGDPLPVLKGAGVAAALACLPWAWRLAGAGRDAGRGGAGRRFAAGGGGGGGDLAILAPLLLASSGPFVGWAPAGLETAAAALAVTVAADQALRGRGGRAGLALAVAAALRPELPVLAPAFALRLAARGSPGALPGFAVAFVPPCLALAAVRRWATGAWLPAAAAWKLGGAGEDPAIGPFLAGLAPALGILAVGAWMAARARGRSVGAPSPAGGRASAPGIPVVGAAAGAPPRGPWDGSPAEGCGGGGQRRRSAPAAPWLARRRKTAQVVLLGAVAGDAGFPVALAALQGLAVGGASLRIEGTISTMAEFDRYFVPVLPVLAAAVARVVGRWPGPVRGPAAAALLTWNLLRPGAGPAAVVGDSLVRASRVTPAAAALAEWLDRELPPTGAVALGDVGLPSHRFRGRILDLFGLHSPADAGLPPGERARRILARAPDAVAVVARERDDGIEAHHRVERELLALPGFRARYRLAARFPGPENPWGYAVYRRVPPADAEAPDARAAARDARAGGLPGSGEGEAGAVAPAGPAAAEDGEDQQQDPGEADPPAGGPGAGAVTEVDLVGARREGHRPGGAVGS
jgi:hypothetical protein